MTSKNHVKCTGNKLPNLIIISSGFPTAQVSTESVTLNQGGSIEIQCTTTGNPPPSVKWTKLGEDLASNTEQFGSTLNIRGARMQDRGVYVCVATNVRGIAQASVIVEVTRKYSVNKFNHIYLLAISNFRFRNAPSRNSPSHYTDRHCWKQRSGTV